MRHFNPQGQGAQEYAIVLCLALMVAIGALGGLGGQVSSLFDGLFGGEAQNVGGSGRNPNEGLNGLLGLVDSGKNGTTSGEKTALRLSANTPLGAAQLMPGAGSPTDSSTSARDGTVHTLASQMGSVADKLLSEEKINAEQYNTLIALANQGHRIATIQKTLEEAYHAANGNDAVFNNTPVVFEGKTYLPLELASGLDSFGQGFQTGNLVTNFGEGAEIVQFRILYQQALANGSLDDPAARTAIDGYGSEIVRISDWFEGGVDGQNLAPYLDSPVETHRNSGGVCNTGKGADSGTNCAG